MLEQKKLPILEALAAFGIGGILTAACMAGLAYLMANQSLAQEHCLAHGQCHCLCRELAAAGSWRFSITAEALSAVLYRSRLFVLLLLGFGLSEGIEPTEMQLARFALVFVFGCLGGVFSILRTERHRH